MASRSPVLNAMAFPNDLTLLPECNSYVAKQRKVLVDFQDKNTEQHALDAVQAGLDFVTHYNEQQKKHTVPDKSLLTRDDHLVLTAKTDLTTSTDSVVCIVGVGYIGESLLQSFGSKYRAIGYDISHARVNTLGPSFAHYSNVHLTSDESALARATHYLISVPTLLNEDRTVNTSHLEAAIAKVVRHARPGCTVVIESSVAVGMTRTFLGPYADKLHCGMSPERVDPGRAEPALQNIPKIVSGLTPEALAKIEAFYTKVFNKVVPVSSPEAAEMTKLYENCYRMINIAYVNEVSDACKAHNININEVIDAASSKPFGFQAFRPGLGVGGHCIPVNPFYLLANNELPVLKHATTKMWQRPAQFAQKLFDEMIGDLGRPPRILVVGVGFKPGQSVISCSPSLSFAAALNQLGCGKLMYHDPLVAQGNISWMKQLDPSCWNSRYLDAEFDEIVVCVKQVGINMNILENLQTAHARLF